MSFPRLVPSNLIFLITVSRKPDRRRISPLQQRILRLAALGCDNGQIAAILGRDESVVKAQKARALRRLGISEDWAIAAWVTQHGLSDAEDRLSPSERDALAMAEGPLRDQPGAPGGDPPSARETPGE